MYFKKFNEFINEDNNTERQIKKLEKEVAQLTKDIDREDNIDKKVFLTKKLMGVNKDLDSFKSRIKTPDPVKTEDSSTSGKVSTDESTSGDVSNMNNNQLQEVLNRWNAKYSQSFKFINNMPKSVEEKNNIQELITEILEDYKISVKDGIVSLCKAFANKNFEGKNIDISGFTSTPATDQYNMDLSIRRAKIVMNAIKWQLENTGINTKITFNAKGFGEQKEFLIIKNDNDLEKLVIMDGVTIGENTLKELESSKEKRQALNRRVEISLPEFTGKIVSKIEDRKEQIVEVEKPKIPDAEKIQFNFDSYILTKESEAILNKFASNLKGYLEKKDEIKDIFISAHTLKAEETNKQQENSQIKKLILLSCNRAFTVKNYIKKIIGKELADKMNYYVYPVAFSMGKEKKVVIEFENSVFMKDAKSKFENIADQMKLSKSEYGYDLHKYIINKPLRDGILYNLRQLIKITPKPVIPLELWYGKDYGRFGLGYEEDLESFKNKVKDIIGNRKVESFIYREI